MDAHEELNLHKLDLNYRLIFGQGGHFDCTSDLDEMTERIRALSGDHNANAFRRYVADNRVKLHKSKACLQEPWYGPTDLSPSEPCAWPASSALSARSLAI